METALAIWCICITFALILLTTGFDKLKSSIKHISGLLSSQLRLEKKMTSIENENKELKKAVDELLSERELEKIRYNRIKEVIEDEQNKRT